MIHIADTDSKPQPPILLVSEVNPSPNTVQASETHSSSTNTSSVATVVDSKTTDTSGKLSTPSITACTSHPSSSSQAPSTGASNNLVYQLQVSTPREYILSQVYPVSDTGDLCYESILRIGNLNSLAGYIHPISPDASTLLHWEAKLEHAELMGKLLPLPGSMSTLLYYEGILNDGDPYIMQH